METTIMRIKDCILIRGENENELSNAVYIVWDDDKSIYVGKTYRSVPQRIREHLKTGHYKWFGMDVEVRTYPIGLNIDLLEIERNLIEELNPCDVKRKKPFNILDLFR